MTRSERIPVAALTLLALACRAPLAYGSAIWADEGMALNVVAIPSIGGMIDFLRLHESHPPLFYLMLRAWRAVAGTSDTAAFSLMLVISILIVPATYIVARSFMSSSASFIAALLVALSPSLAEHSTQIRPYGLLPLLVLLSSYFLVAGLERRGWKRWSGYVLLTTLMLYTHNWSWLVVGGQAIAGMIALWRLPAGKRRALEFAAVLLVVVILYLPWLGSLIFQAARAGHSGVPLQTMSDWLWFYVFALISVPDYLLLGLYPRSALPLILFAGLIAATAVVVIAVAPGLSNRVLRPGRAGEGRSMGRSVPVVIFLVSAATAIAAAIILSPWSVLFIQRCVAMFTPVFLILVVAMTARVLSTRGSSGHAALGVGLLSFLLALEVAGVAALAATTRSNARDVARVLQGSMRSDDLLIVSPEWFAPSFNHYFPPSIEQHDHPQAGRSGLVDFTGTQRRTLDPAATDRLTRLVADARGSGRRVWLVSERTYLRYVDDVLPTLATEAQRARYAPVRRVKEARDLLTNAYGPPDTTYFVRGRVSRYEELLPLLFQPSPAASRPF